MAESFISPETIADTRAMLDQAGFYRCGLAAMDLPETQLAPAGRDAQPVPYAAFGVADAPLVVVEATPYLTQLTDHFKIRLEAHQAVLGDDFQVIGVEAYTPGVLSRIERGRLSDGNFSPLSDRVRRVLDAEFGRFRRDQTIVPYGYSMGADIATQLAASGTEHVARVGVFEPARVQKRSQSAVVRAMQSSGARLHENVSASNMPALNEAWGIGDSTTREDFDKRVFNDAVQYLRADVLGTLALIKGFSSNATAEQLIELLRKPYGPEVVFGTQTGSTLSGSEFLRRLAPRDQRRLHVVTEAPNDHSCDDHILRSAARMLHFAGVDFISQ